MLVLRRPRPDSTARSKAKHVMNDILPCCRTARIGSIGCERIEIGCIDFRRQPISEYPRSSAMMTTMLGTVGFPPRCGGGVGLTDEWQHAETDRQPIKDFDCREKFHVDCCWGSVCHFDATAPRGRLELRRNRQHSIFDTGSDSIFLVVCFRDNDKPDGLSAWLFRTLLFVSQ